MGIGLKLSIASGLRQGGTSKGGEGMSYKSDMMEPATGPIYGPIPTWSNAAVNRSYAALCLRRGMHPREIADEWPEVWTCDIYGQIGQRYDSWFVQDPEVKEIARMITRESVNEELTRRGFAPLADHEPY